jgi:hypothetical protein
MAVDPPLVGHEHMVTPGASGTAPPRPGRQSSLLGLRQQPQVVGPLTQRDLTLMVDVLAQPMDRSVATSGTLGDPKVPLYAVTAPGS